MTVTNIKTSVGDNVVKRGWHNSKTYPPLSPQEMEAFLLFVQARPFLPANMTYRDWYEQEKEESKRKNTLLNYVEEFK